jgi:hypothetical protein
MKQLMNEARFSKAELKIQAIARRRASSQLMRVPWTKFCRAYAAYPRRHALALWVQAIVATQDNVPAWLLTDLQKRCPRFVEHGAPSREPKLVALQLLQWVHNQEFGYAKRQGWLDALIFYGVRHPRSECAWAYWEHCDLEWNRNQPNAFPTFDQWWQQAQQMILCDKISYCDVGKAVEKYLDWEALVVWLRPLLASNVNLPPHVTSELERRFPGILGCQISGTLQSHQEKSKIWRRLIGWSKDHCLSEAKKAGWLDSLLRRVRSHPRHVRIVAYGRFWAKDWSRNCPQPYLSFREWRQAADRYIDPARK